VANLIYSAITSLDGYVADEEGNFDWAAPDEEGHSFVNELERPVGTYLYGRRMYEVMATGRPRILSPISHHRPSAISPRSGRRRTRSFTRRRWSRPPAPGRGSSGSSTLRRSGD
jgi:dihydrofolate reductase